MAEKYALEIEIFALNRRFRTQIWRSCLQKGVFSVQYAGSLEEPTVFKRIGRYKSFATSETAESIAFISFDSHAPFAQGF